MKKLKSLKPTSQLHLFPAHTSPPHLMYFRESNGSIAKKQFNIKHCAKSDEYPRTLAYICADCFEFSIGEGANNEQML